MNVPEELSRAVRARATRHQALATNPLSPVPCDLYPVSRPLFPVP